MFLKTLLYKPICEICSSPLKRQKVFCDYCQADCYYQLTHNDDFCLLDKKQIFFFINKNIYLKKLFQLASNPRQIFLIENIANLIALTLSAPHFLYPEVILFNSIFKQENLNRLLFKELKKSLGLNVYKKKDLDILANKRVLCLVNSLQAEEILCQNPHISK